MVDAAKEVWPIAQREGIANNIKFVHGNLYIVKQLLRVQMAACYCISHEWWEFVLDQVRLVLAVGRQLEFIDEHAVLPVRQTTTTESATIGVVSRADARHDDPLHGLLADGPRGRRQPNILTCTAWRRRTSTRHALVVAILMVAVSVVSLRGPHNNPEAWHEQAEAARELEWLLEHMMDVKFAMHLHPLQHALERQRLSLLDPCIELQRMAYQLGALHRALEQLVVAALEQHSCRALQLSSAAHASSSSAHSSSSAVHSSSSSPTVQQRIPLFVSLFHQHVRIIFHAPLERFLLGHPFQLLILCGDAAYERYERRALDADAQWKEKHAAAWVEEREINPMIPVSPVPDLPRLLGPIPYLPETITHLPLYSLDAIKPVWHEACAPLQYCRCTVCERAMAAQGGNTGKATTSLTTTSAPTPAAKENKEAPREKDSDGSPWVMHIPAKDATTAGTEGVIKLVEDGSLSASSSSLPSAAQSSPSARTSSSSAS
ncbi:hypothetical protein B0H13DRAFT_2321557 [Mycena leptocephala]|nr:hypothetical protein B0H13DRAFT_2321557 [Mycena leptocephala]